MALKGGPFPATVSLLFLLLVTGTEGTYGRNRYLGPPRQFCTSFLGFTTVLQRPVPLV